MNGFKIEMNGSTREISVPNGLFFISIHQTKDEAYMSIYGVDNNKLEKYCWLKQFPITIGDKIKIEISELLHTTPPLTISKAEKRKNARTKLEVFNELELKLKKKGLI